MNQSKYENGAIITKNHAVLEEYEIDVYFELCNEVAKLLKNVDGLGRQELPNGTETEVREKGVQLLKENYATAYDNLVKRIGELANQYIKINCFNLMFYQDAANIMLVNPVEVIRGYISEKSSDVKKAIFMDYSVLEFTGIVDEIREKVTKLAIDNWEKHMEISK